MWPIYCPPSSKSGSTPRQTNRQQQLPFFIFHLISARSRTRSMSECSHGLAVNGQRSTVWAQSTSSVLLAGWVRANHSDPELSSLTHCHQINLITETRSHCHLIRVRLICTTDALSSLYKPGHESSSPLPESLGFFSPFGLLIR